MIIKVTHHKVILISTNTENRCMIFSDQKRMMYLWFKHLLYMCGRGSLTINEKQLELKFGKEFYSEDLERYHPLPNYNIAPSHRLPVIKAIPYRHPKFWSISHRRTLGRVEISRWRTNTELHIDHPKTNRSNSTYPWSNASSDHARGGAHLARSFHSTTGSTW